MNGIFEKQGFDNGEINTVYWFWKNNMITLDDVNEFMEYTHGDWRKFIKLMDFEDKRIINK
tara:strand:- start:688 stop:870 length:183 start_codon:yes stop_codon:yes gene_type:complete